MKKNIIIGVIVALLVGLAIGYALHQPAKVGGAISTATPTGFDNISISGGIRQGVPTSEYPVAPAVNTVVGNGLATIIVSGSFASATTTLALIANPFNATSTITFAEIQGKNGTSTIDILVGTTTKTTGQSVTNNTQVSATLMNPTVIATSTNFFSVAGAQSGPSGYYNNPGAASGMIVVGPSDLVAIFATSSYASYAAAVTGLTSLTSTFSGTYTIEWQR